MRTEERLDIFKVTATGWNVLHNVPVRVEEIVANIIVVGIHLRAVLTHHEGLVGGGISVTPSIASGFGICLPAVFCFGGSRMRT